MKKHVAVCGTLVLLVMLIAQVAPTGAAPVDCDALASGGISNLSSLDVNFNCAADSIAYFGTCDSGNILDDFFHIVYNGNVVASNQITGSNETITIGSATVSAGSHTATLVSLTDSPAIPATYSYAISSDLSTVENYLQASCGADFGGLTPGAGCNKIVPVFTTDTAPSNGTLEFRVMFGNEDSREDAQLHRVWNISAGQRINNDMVSNLPAPRWARLWWHPEGDSGWYLLTSQYWNGDGTTASEYGLSCLGAQPSYHTSFASAIPESEVCFDLPNGCN